MVKWLVWSLVFPPVECDGSARSNKFHPHGVLISSFLVNEELESIEDEENAG